MRGWCARDSRLESPSPSVAMTHVRKIHGMKLRIRYAAGLGARANGGSELVSSVELSGGAGGVQGATLRDLKFAVLGGSASGDTLPDTAGLDLSLGNSPLVPPVRHTDADTSLQSLGVVQNDIVWVTSLPVSSPVGASDGRRRASPRRAAENLPASVQSASGSDASVVRVIVAAAMESIGFDPVASSSSRYSLSVDEEAGAGVGVLVSTSVMTSSCMLVGETGGPSAAALSVARLLRFQGTSTVDDRLSLFLGVTDAFCVPLLQACCRSAGVACPLETLPGLPREMIEMIVERLQGCEAPRSLGMTCKRLAAIVFDPSGTLYRRVLDVRPRLAPTRVGPVPPGMSRRSYPAPIGGGMDRHIIGGAYDMMPGGGFGGLPPRGPTRSSQRWRLS